MVIGQLNCAPLASSNVAASHEHAASQLHRPRRESSSSDSSGSSSSCDECRSPPVVDDSRFPSFIAPVDLSPTPLPRSLTATGEPPLSPPPPLPPPLPPPPPPLQQISRQSSCTSDDDEPLPTAAILSPSSADRVEPLDACCSSASRASSRSCTSRSGASSPNTDVGDSTRVEAATGDPNGDDGEHARQKSHSRLRSFAYSGRRTRRANLSSSGAAAARRSLLVGVDQRRRRARRAPTDHSLVVHLVAPVDVDERRLYRLLHDRAAHAGR